MVNDAKLSVEEAENLFKNLNIEIPTPVVPETDTSNVKEPTLGEFTVPENAVHHQAAGT